MVSDKLIFKQEHFIGLDSQHELFFSKRVFAAERAQQLFDAWLEKQPTVYGRPNDDGPDELMWYQGKPEINSPLGDTHSAKLVCIQELKKCEHPPEKVLAQENSSHIVEYECECGAKVKPSAYEVVE